MLKPLVTGLFLAIGAAVVLLLGAGSDLEHAALLGACIGGALGLAHPERVAGRLVGFTVGFLAAWAGFAIRAAVLPDSTAGRAVAAVLVVAVCTLVASLSRDRLPLWASLLGCAALVASYESTYRNAPALFLTESPRAATTILLAAAVGVLVTSLAHALVPARRDTDADADDRSLIEDLRDRIGARDEDAQDSMDDLMERDDLMEPHDRTQPRPQHAHTRPQPLTGDHA